MECLLKEYAETLLINGAISIREKPFKLRSGGTSHVYLDHRHLILQSKNLDVMLRVYEHLANRFDGWSALCLLDSVCSPILGGALALSLNKNLIITKSKPLAHGMEKQVWLGNDNTAVCIDDIITSGALLRETVALLREKGVHVIGAISPVLRKESVLGTLPDIRIETLGSLNDVLYVLKDRFNPHEISLLKSEGLLQEVTLAEAPAP